MNAQLWTSYIEQFGWVLVHSVWLFSLIALAAMSLQRLAQRASASVRYLILICCFSAMIATPAMTWIFVGDKGEASVAQAQSAKSGPRNITDSPSNAQDVPGAPATSVPSNSNAITRS